MVAQQYLMKPLLIDGYKFDMRIYTLIMGCDPLKIFLYKEGMGRFCTETYQAPTEDNMVRSDQIVYPY
jgi:tubulin polyglutamylase TTLL6/13